MHQFVEKTKVHVDAGSESTLLVQLLMSRSPLKQRKSTPRPKQACIQNRTQVPHDNTKWRRPLAGEYPDIDFRKNYSIPGTISRITVSIALIHSIQKHSHTFSDTTNQHKGDAKRAIGYSMDVKTANFQHRATYFENLRKALLCFTTENYGRSFDGDAGGAIKGGYRTSHAFLGVRYSVIISTPHEVDVSQDPVRHAKRASVISFAAGLDQFPRPVTRIIQKATKKVVPSNRIIRPIQNEVIACAFAGRKQIGPGSHSNVHRHGAKDDLGGPHAE